MPYLLFIVLALFIIIAITRPLTVFVHELGHAIPAILLTKKKTTIYIGSYGDPKNSIKLKIGLLEVCFKYNFLLWRAGLCIPSAEDISISKRIIYTICGPLASLIAATIASYFIFKFDMHGSFKLIIILFLGSAIYDLFVNIIPNSHPINLYNGEIAYNDGYQLKQLFHYRKISKEYKKGWELYKKNDFLSASKFFEEAINQNIEDDSLFRLAITAFLQLKGYPKALEIHNKFETKFTLISDDYANSGLIKSQLGFNEESLHDYDKSLALNPDNRYSLNNKGYTLNLLGRYEEAIVYFNKSIQIDPKFAYSFNNRGLSKIKTGQIEDGLADIRYSLELDSNNSYAYRNLGIYHLDKKENNEALKFFTKAKELDKDTHMIDDLIAKAIG